MSFQVSGMECPGCGAPVSLDESNCQYCSRPIIIRTFNSVYSMSFSDINKQSVAYTKALKTQSDNSLLNLSAAYCYLKLGVYDKASSFFEKAIEDNFDDSEAYFYTAISLLKGKRPFLSPKAVIEKAEKYLNAAVSIEPKGIYYYLWSYIRYDFYFKKFLKVTPDYTELFSKAKQCGLSETDVKELFGILKVERPSDL